MHTLGSAVSERCFIAQVRQSVLIVRLVARLGRTNSFRGGNHELGNLDELLLQTVDRLSFELFQDQSLNLAFLQLSVKV